MSSVTAGDPGQWWMYVLRCSDGSFYTGATSDLWGRLEKHNKGKGSKYVAARRPAHMLIAWQYDNKRQALRSEAAFKRLTRVEKERHVLHPTWWDGPCGARSLDRILLLGREDAG